MFTTLLAAHLAGIAVVHAEPIQAQEPPVATVAGERQAWSKDDAWVKAHGVTLQYDEPPRPVKTTQPAYPKDALRKKIEGVVVVEFVIDRRGRVSQTQILESVAELDSAALKCVKAWRFQPAKKDGQPVATVASVPVAFWVTKKSPNSSDAK